MRDLLHGIFRIFRWLGRNIALRPLSWIYGLVVFVRNRLYDRGAYEQVSVGVRVISVGNLSTGGAGKTPMAEYLIRQCLAAGRRPAYLSRGYGRRTRGFRLVDPAADVVEDVGDEAMQVAGKFPGVPVAVCEDRVKGAEELLARRKFDVLILDDAFQHRRIARDLDLVVVDANRPPWNDRLLPLGRLREPMGALKRADLVVVNKVFEEDKIRSFQKRVSYKLSFTRTVPSQLAPFDPDNDVISLKAAARRACILFSGVGNNDQFILEAKRLGLIVMRSYRFADHHNYRENDMRRVARRFRKLKDQQYLVDLPVIVTTEKDYMRLRSLPWFREKFGDLPFYYLTITLELIRGKDLFDETIRPFLNQLPKENDERQRI